MVVAVTAVVAYGCRKGAPTSSSTSSKHMSATICSIPVHDGVFGSQVVNSVQQQQQKEGNEYYCHQKSSRRCDPQPYSYCFGWEK